MYKTNMTETTNRKIIEKKDNVTIFEYDKDLSVNPGAAMQAYYSSKMNIRKRQVMIELDKDHEAIIQAGAMQWTAGSVSSGTNVKGIGDFAKKLVSSKVTNESAIKPRYMGEGVLILEPTFKYLIIEDVGSWNGMVIDDGLFLACDGKADLKTVARKSFSSAVAGGEGLFNTCLTGSGFAVLECSCPREELVEIELQDDELKIDGNYAIAWSESLSFTVERSTKTLIGSAASGEGLVNVYRGTGKVLMAPL
ncbi:MAG: AIM24 family protein [Roseburia sp.]|nr:AIM24 family protein [Roseburia sp.]